MLDDPLHGTVRVSSLTTSVTESPRAVDYLLLRERYQVACLKRKVTYDITDYKIYGGYEPYSCWWMNLTNLEIIKFQIYLTRFVFVEKLIFSSGLIHFLSWEFYSFFHLVGFPIFHMTSIGKINGERPWDQAS